MDVRTCRIVGLKGSGDNSVYFPTIQSRTLLDSFTNHLKRKMSMIPCYVRNQFAGNSDFEAWSRGWEPSKICPPVKWTNNCNRAIVETLNEDFIPEFEDKIAGSGGREDAFIQCILRHGHGARSWWRVCQECGNGEIPHNLESELSVRLSQGDNSLINMFHSTSSQTGIQIDII